MSPTESVTCGNVEIDFYLNDGMMTPLDPSIFDIRKVAEDKVKIFYL